MIEDFLFLLQLKGKPGQNWESVSDEYQKDEVSSPTSTIVESSSDKENKSEAQYAETKNEKSDSVLSDHQSILIKNDELVEDDTSDEGWQEAVPRGRSLTSRRFSGSKRQSLAKLNTNFMNVSQSSRYRSKPSNFTSPKPIANESAASPASGISIVKKFVKSASFSPKPSSPSPSPVDKPTPTTVATSDQLSKSAPVSNSISVQAAGKLFSYKEVALAPPGTIVKAVTEQLPKASSGAESSPQARQEASDATCSKNGENKTEKPAEEKPLQDSEEEVKKSSANEELKADESLAQKNGAATGKIKADKDEKVSVSEAGNIETIPAKDSNADSSKTDVLDTGAFESSPANSPNLEPLSVSAGKPSTLLENDASAVKEKPADATLPELPNGEVSSPTGGEKQDESETVKETKKLSAAAPPFNPSTVPVFGSVPVPGYKDHGGILPPPVNIPPMLTVNPVRRSPHQSATARVPYGPRLSGGYNRSGNRVPRNKPNFHNGEHTSEANHYSPPRIMNPHAAEFVPSQPWVPNGYPVSPNGYLASAPNGYPVSPNGVPVLPNGYQTTLNGLPVTQNGFPTSPIGSVESPSIVTVEVGAATLSENVEPEEGDDVMENPADENQTEEEKQVPEDQPVMSTEAEKPTKEICIEKQQSVGVAEAVEDKKQGKCWGDYSDSEAEIVEVQS